ncbi:MAG: MarR family transcriptional regulator, partial [Actinomycetota bacterium]|nr:MarR family transcriptional regulator [Actinomycetota bacterium]
VNTLERDGLVDRRRESDDRRVVTVYLTNDGAERLEAAYRTQNAREGALLGGLDADELSTLTDLMRRVSSTRIDD